MTTSAAHCATLDDIVSYQARVRPRATALWWAGEPITYAALAGQVERIARRIAHCGKQGDRIGVLAWNCPEFVAVIYAAARAGRILVPLNARLAPREWREQLSRTDCNILLGDPALLTSLIDDPNNGNCAFTCIPFGDDWQRWLDENGAQSAAFAPPPRRSDDPAWILFTSGSTGRPKGAVLTHRSFLAGLESAAIARPVHPDDRYYYPFPLFHVAAHNVLLQHRHGAAVVLTASFDAGQTLHACRNIGVTSMSLAPTMMAMLLEHSDFDAATLSTVRSIGYGASAMPEALLRELLDKTSIDFCQSYGMTELSGSVSFLTAADHRQSLDNPGRLRSVGRPLRTARVEIVDAHDRLCATGEAGEIRVRAAQCMAGYWRDEEATAAALRDGWLYTGDIGRLDGDGYLTIVDRKKDMIISGGENVASLEVEEQLRDHPAVRHCAVIGLPDPRWGEAVCAVIVARAGMTPDREQLARWCRERLAGYKTPKHWFYIESLPLNASGKVDKPALRRRFASAQTSTPVLPTE